MPTHASLGHSRQRIEVFRTAGIDKAMDKTRKTIWQRCWRPKRAVGDFNSRCCRDHYRLIHVEHALSPQNLALRRFHASARIFFFNYARPPARAAPARSRAFQCAVASTVAAKAEPAEE
jgi:hypothetical protein